MSEYTNFVLTIPFTEEDIGMLVNEIIRIRGSNLHEFINVRNDLQSIIDMMDIVINKANGGNKCKLKLEK